MVWPFRASIQPFALIFQQHQVSHVFLSSVGWMNDWMRDAIDINVTTSPNRWKMYFSHITRRPQLVHQSSVIHRRLESYYPPTLPLCVCFCHRVVPYGYKEAATAPDILSFIQEPKFRQEEEGHCEVWRKLSQKPWNPLMPHWRELRHMTTPKPVIGKVSATDMTRLTSPGRHPRRGWRELQPLLKILVIPYLNKLKILMAPLL